MPDLSKHLTRAKQVFEKGGCDMALEILSECVDVDPTNIEIYKLLIPIAKRKAKERSGKTSLFGSLSMPTLSTDPHKQFTGAVKALGKSGDTKLIAQAMDAAIKLSGTVKAMNDVAIFLGEEFRATGLLNEKVLWGLAHKYMERFDGSGGKDYDAIDKAIKVMGELDRAMPNHPEASRTLKNWLAKNSFSKRPQGGSTGDYTKQIANTDAARRQEVMNRNIRTLEDAREVLKYIDDDLQKTPGDKFLWQKKGDVHRRINELPQAKAAYEKAAVIDQHDFVVIMRLGDIRILEAQEKVKAAAAGSPELAAAKKTLLEVEVTEYRLRVERQPTDMNHRFNLGLRLVQLGDVDGAAGEFQRSVSDPRLRKSSHRYLGYCFQKKNLLDLAIQQYKLFLPLVEDELSDEAKDGRYQLARLYEDRGNSAAAIAEFEKLVVIDLGYKDAETRLSKLRG